MRCKQDIYSHVCTVSARLSVGDREALEGTCSGILIDPQQGLVLTHASMLYPLTVNMRREKMTALRRSGIVMGNDMFDGVLSVSVILPNDTKADRDMENDKNRNLLPSLLNSDIQDFAPFSIYKGHIKSIFECRSLRKTLEKVTPKDTWQFSEDTSDQCEHSESPDQLQEKSSPRNEEMQYFLLPCFVLLKLRDFHGNDMAGLSVRSARSNRQGDPVEICATPFGGLSPDVFLNSCSRGIISNLAGPRGVLIMTDARCIPGSEGGAMFHCHSNQRTLTGILIATLCWKNVEWVGLSLACAITEVLGNLKGYLTLNPNATTPVIGQPTCSDLVSRLKQSVCCVRVGHSWGSGVSVDPDQRVFLTCSHVLRGDHLHSVSLRTNQDTGLRCDVLYRTPLRRQFDLALIRVSGKAAAHSDRTHGKTANQGSGQRVTYEGSTNQIPEMQEWEVPVGQVQDGDVVYVIGHALFRDDLNMPPTVTMGIVSKILSHNRVPVMIQTTCAVHAGASGGGVFNTRGQLVAMAVCNSKDTTSGACYPHVNMCVPMATISPVINEFLSTGDAAVLHSLSINNSRVSRLWSIGEPDAAVLTSHL